MKKLIELNQKNRSKISFILPVIGMLFIFLVIQDNINEMKEKKMTDLAGLALFASRKAASPYFFGNGATSPFLSEPYLAFGFGRVGGAELFIGGFTLLIGLIAFGTTLPEELFVGDIKVEEADGDFFGSFFEPLVTSLVASNLSLSLEIFFSVVSSLELSQLFDSS